MKYQKFKWKMKKVRGAGTKTKGLTMPAERIADFSQKNRREQFVHGDL